MTKTLPLLQHSKISPTAKLVAYWRQFSDVPYAKDVATLFGTERVYQDMFHNANDKLLKNNIMIPLLELRYKCLFYTLLDMGIKNVLEFASGIALRGLAMTENPDLTYVETDLPGLTEEKTKLLDTIMSRHGLKTRGNLFFHVANILNYEEIEPALKHFQGNTPIAIVHEGLLQYLTHPEKRAAAINIHKILKQFGGVWLTPDLDIKSRFHDIVFDKERTLRINEHHKTNHRSRF